MSSAAAVDSEAYLARHSTFPFYLDVCPLTPKLTSRTPLLASLTRIQAIAMSGPLSKRDRFNTFFQSLKSKRSSQPSQSTALSPSNSIEQSSSTIVPGTTGPVSTSIPSTDELQLPNQPIAAVGPISLPTRPPNLAVSIHQSVTDTFSKDLWSKAFRSSQSTIEHRFLV
jgi:hypothetical protein